MSHERNNQNIEWYTPNYIIEALGGAGNFDLDPAAPSVRIVDTAKEYYTKEDDGLSKEWKGRVFLNPPYQTSLIGSFMDRLSAHGNGIAFVAYRTDTRWFQEHIFQKADAIFFIKGRVRFVRSDGVVDCNAGFGSVLVAYGKENACILQKCGLNGKYVPLLK